MQLKKLKPTSPGNRHSQLIKKSLYLNTNNFKKIIVKGKKNFSGRGSNPSKITIRHIGGGCKKLFREVKDCSKNRLSIVVGITTDPRRSAPISLCYDFLSNIWHYQISTKELFPGSIVAFQNQYPIIKLGNTIKLHSAPVGSIIHSLSSFGRIKYIKSAGTFGIIIQHTSTNSKIKMPSGNVKNFCFNNLNCILGSIPNELHKNIIYGKAGRKRLLGHRPRVRGVAMNPVDHPHGGQTSGGSHPKTPWGKLTRGVRTSKNKNK